MKKIILFLFTILILYSCKTRMLDFSIISSKNIEIEKLSKCKKGTTRTEGRDVGHIIVYVPISTPNIKEALDNAIEKIPGCVALVDGVLYSYGFYIPLIYGQDMYIVEGTPLIDPSQVHSNIDTSFPEYGIISIDKKGNVEMVEISQDKFNEIKEKVLSKKPFKAYLLNKHLKKLSLTKL